MAMTSPSTAAMPGPARDAYDDRALRAAFAAVARRVRVQRALDAGAWSACAGLVLFAIGLGLSKLGWVHDMRAWVAGGIGVAASGFAYGAARRVSPLYVAQALDRSLGAPDLLGSAWAFLNEPAERRSAFMHACIGQALRAAQRAEPASVLPLQRPRAWPHAAVAGVAVLAIALIHLPAAPHAVAKPVQKPRLLHQDDIQAFREETAALKIDAQADPDLRDATRELNTLLEALRDQKLDRADALRELRGLSERLQDAALGADDEALREALRELGRALAGTPQIEALTNALAAADAAKARAELERLAEQLKAQPSPSNDARKKLERALDRAAKAKSDEAKAQLDKARAELERLLKKKNEGQNDEQQQRLLRKKQRELDQLERNAEQRARGERKLDDLRRELGSSGQSLGAGKNGEAAQHMQQAAQQMQRAERSQMSEQQRKQLRDRVEQLRELINKQRQAQQQTQGSQQNGGGKQPQGQRLNMERFSQSARGGGQPQDPNEQNGRKPDGTLLMPGQGDKPGEPILMPGEDTPNAQQAITETMRDAREGTEAGQGGKPESERATKLDGTRVDTRVSGEQRAGLTRSQVIRDASQHGFVTRDYERVHGEYERHAEAVIDRDKIPGGYRFYVRRYFQLIRPREETR
jgi:hypothetical protein